MRVLTYGFADMGKIIHRFGEGEYSDVSMQYTDMLAIPADKVVISLRNIEPEILKLVRAYEKETKGYEQAEFIYVTPAEEADW